MYSGWVRVMMLYASSGRDEMRSFGGIEYVRINFWKVDRIFSADVRKYA